MEEAGRPKHSSIIPRLLGPRGHGDLKCHYERLAVRWSVIWVFGALYLWKWLNWIRIWSVPSVGAGSSRSCRVTVASTIMSVRTPVPCWNQNPGGRLCSTTLESTRSSQSNSMNSNWSFNQLLICFVSKRRQTIRARIHGRGPYAGENCRGPLSGFDPHLILARSQKDFRNISICAAFAATRSDGSLSAGRGEWAFVDAVARNLHANSWLSNNHTAAVKYESCKGKSVGCVGSRVSPYGPPAINVHPRQAARGWVRQRRA